MKRSTRAALLSGLIFPGLGHLFLGRYLVGIALAGGSLVVIYRLFSAIARTASDLAEQLQNGNAQLGIDGITAMLSQQPNLAGADSLNAHTFAFLVLWLIGIVDSYRIGRAHDKGAGDGDV
ncbi:MAG: hypothetical protein H6961_01935 [Chromatiaceae bacterium]|nr:hypothetical protein [Chromatiaceae bacterium]MCP5439950.1 hypothetical protein [Chromatiaceae bacterium]